MNRVLPTILLALAASVLPADSAPFSSAAELARHTLRVREAARRFELSARVTHVIRNPAYKVIEFAVADDTGAAVVFGAAREAPPDLKAGDVVRLSGSTSADEKVIPLFSSIARTGRVPVPETPVASAREILSGAFDWRPARITGTVRDLFHSELNPDWLVLVLDCGDDTLYASTPVAGMQVRPYEDLLEASVTLTGVCLPRDGSHRLQMGRVLHFGGMTAIEAVRPASSDPFAKPDLEAAAGHTPAELARLGRHRATGRVVAVWSKSHLLLRTPRGRIVHVALAKSVLPAFGDFVEVAGLPESDLFSLNLTRAVWRPAAPFPLQDDPVQDIPASQVFRHVASHPNFNPVYHGRPVRMRGAVRSLPGVGNQDGIMYLESETYLFPVDISAVPETAGVLEPGSEISVTGTCVMDTENWRPNAVFPQIKGFTVVVNAPDGIQVLVRPPWWTPGRLTTVIGALLAALAGIFVWNRVLNRLAERRGRALLQARIGQVRSELKTEERTRLAVELHDSLAQSLTGVSMQLEAANDLRGDAPADMLERLDFAAKTLKSCRDELRNCLWDLRSQALEEPDMTRAVVRTLQPHLNDSRLSVRFNVPRARLSDNTTHAILQVVRELVLNALRHGQATDIRVAGCLDAGGVHFSVQDNGRGFDPDACPGVLQGHFGLQGIRERVAKLGGDVTVDSTPGRGTAVKVNLHPSQSEEIPA